MRTLIARPQLWLWALDIMLLMSLFFLVAVPAKITSGNTEKKFLISEVQEDFYHLSIGAHLFPFVIHLKALNPADGREVIINADIFLGFVFMILGFLFVIVNTRNAMDGVYVTIPFLLYSFLILGVMSYLISEDTDAIYSLSAYPTMLLLVLFTLASGVSATLIGRWLEKSGAFRERESSITIELH